MELFCQTEITLINIFEFAHVQVDEPYCKLDNSRAKIPVRRCHKNHWYPLDPKYTHYVDPIFGYPHVDTFKPEYKVNEIDAERKRRKTEYESRPLPENEAVPYLVGNEKGNPDNVWSHLAKNIVIDVKELEKQNSNVHLPQNIVIEQDVPEKGSVEPAVIEETSMEQDVLEKGSVEQDVPEDTLIEIIPADTFVPPVVPERIINGNAQDDSIVNNNVESVNNDVGNPTTYLNDRTECITDLAVPTNLINNPIENEYFDQSNVSVSNYNKDLVEINQSQNRLDEMFKIILQLKTDLDEERETRKKIETALINSVDCFNKMQRDVNIIMKRGCTRFKKIITTPKENNVCIKLNEDEDN